VKKRTAEEYKLRATLHGFKVKQDIDYNYDDDVIEEIENISEEEKIKREQIVLKRFNDLKCRRTKI
jgi:hypothetical protein